MTHIKRLNEMQSLNEECIGSDHYPWERVVCRKKVGDFKVVITLDTEKEADGCKDIYGYGVYAIHGFEQESGNGATSEEEAMEWAMDEISYLQSHDDDDDDDDDDEW
jgi:hypothetical protein